MYSASVSADGDPFLPTNNHRLYFLKCITLIPCKGVKGHRVVILIYELFLCVYTVVIDCSSIFFIYLFFFTTQRQMVLLAGVLPSPFNLCSCSNNSKIKHVNTILGLLHIMVPHDQHDLGSATDCVRGARTAAFNLKEAQYYYKTTNMSSRNYYTFCTLCYFADVH